MGFRISFFIQEFADSDPHNLWLYEKKTGFQIVIRIAIPAFNYFSIIFIKISWHKSIALGGWTDLVSANIKNQLVGTRLELHTLALQSSFVTKNPSYYL